MRCSIRRAQKVSTSTAVAMGTLWCAPHARHGGTYSALLTPWSLNPPQQVQQMSRFQLCSECYHAEQAATVAGVPTRLPAGIHLVRPQTPQSHVVIGDNSTLDSIGCCHPGLNVSQKLGQDL